MSTPKSKKKKNARNAKPAPHQTHGKTSAPPVSSAPPAPRVRSPGIAVHGRSGHSGSAGSAGSSGTSGGSGSSGGSAPAAKPWEHAKSGEGSGGDPLAARFVESLSYDRRLYKHDIAGSIAHATMLQKVGLINAKEMAAIKKGLKEIEAEIDAAGADYGAAWPGWKVELEDVHMCIEAALIEKIGDPGRKLHTGRSRNDQVALDLTLWLDDVNQELKRKFSSLIHAFIGLAESNGQIPMPSYTHLQRAQPVVVGGELIAWMVAIDRCRARFNLISNPAVSCNPLGSGAIAGSSLPLDRAATTISLFYEPRIARGHGRREQGDESMVLHWWTSPNSIQATASRDGAIDFLFGLSATAMTLSRWAEQWIIYATTEFGFITLDGKYTTGSSMMPQKRNPDMLELIRGRCGTVYGHLVALLTILKGLPIGYNRDLQEDKRHVFAAYDIVSDCLDMAARIVATTKFNEAKIKQGLEHGFLDATSLAEYLVTKGVPFRTAHQIVGSLVRTCETRGFHKLAQLAVDDFNITCTRSGQKAVCGQDVYDWLGPENVVKRYKTYGNAGVSGFEEQLKAWKERMK